MKADIKRKTGLIISLLLCFGILLSHIPDFFKKQINYENMGDGKITVYVEGAVNQPGTYQLFAGDIKNDVVSASGGLKKDADIDDAVLLQPAIDNEHFYIPYKSEASKLININTAGPGELATLPGIGEKTAMKIISYREQSGGFKKISEIKNVPGIGDKKFLMIKDLIITD